MRVLIFTDLHLTDKDAVECTNVLNEILSIAEENNVEQLWNIGDTFDVYTPSSTCMDIYADFVKAWGKTIINVVASSHESTEIGKSVLNHYSILEPNYFIYNGQVELCSGKYLLGHFMVSESSFGYKIKRSISDLKQYTYAFLGHQHSPQDMENVIHVGSCRYVGFTEYADSKRVLILDTETDELEEVILQSPYDMYVIGVNKDTVEDLDLHLNNIVLDSKVKIIFNDVESYKTYINALPELKTRYKDFKVELNFEIKGTAVKEETVNSFSNDLLKWLDDNNVDSEIKDILKKEVNDVK